MATDDIATLGFRADTTDLTRASSELDRLSSRAQSAQTATDKFKDSVTGFTGVLRAAIGAMAAWEVTKLTVSAVQTAARFETLGVVMEVAGRNAGYSAQQMNVFEQALNKQGIAMQEARSTITQMSAAQIDLSKSSELARASQDLAVVGNINSSEAFARMVAGVQKGEQEILRTIGLNVQWEQGYAQLAGRLGKTTESLTTQEKVLSRTNTVLQAAASYTGIYEAAMATAGKQLTSMPRYISDISTNLGQMGLEAFSDGIKFVTAILKDLDTQIKQLASDGSLQQWSHDIAAVLKIVASHLDQVVVALAVYKAAQISMMAYTTASTSVLANNIRIFGFMQVASQQAALAVKSFGASLLAISTNPVFVITALGTGLYTLWSTMREGSSQTRELATSFMQVSQAAGEANKATKEYQGTMMRVAIQDAMSKVDSATKVFEEEKAKLDKQMAEILTSANSDIGQAESGAFNLDAWRLGGTEVIRILQDVNNGTKTTAEAYDELFDAMAAGTVPTNSATQDLTMFMRATLAAQQNLDKMKASLDKTQQSLIDFDNSASGVKATKELAASLLDAQAALDKYHTSTKMPSSAEDAVTFLMKYTAQSKVAEEAQKTLAAAQAKAALAALTQAAQIALVNDELDKFNAITEMMSKFQAAMNADGTVRTPKSGVGAANKAADAQKKLNEELAKAKGTEAEKVYTEIDTKIRELEKDLKGTNPKIRELREELTKKADRDLMQAILEKTDPTAAGIAKVNKEYDELIRNIDTAQTRGLITADQADKMKGQAGGWQTAQQIEQQNSLLTQQIDLVNKIVDLGGQTPLALELQSKQISAISEKLRAQFPELAALVNQWAVLAQQDLRKPERELERQLAVLRKNRDAWSGVQAAAISYYLDATNYAAQMEKVMTTALDNMADALTNFVMTGKISFADMANEFIRQIIRMQMQAAVSGIFKGITSLVGGMFSPSAGTPTSKWSDFGYTAGPSMPISAYHNGGVVGSSMETFSRNLPAELFANAPRFHTGGGYFGTDEYPAVLQRGELVLDRGDTAQYLSGGSTTSNNTQMSQEIVINFYDSEGNQQQQKTQSDGMNNMNIDVLVGQIDQKMAQRVLNGTSQTGRAMDTTRGTGRARTLY